MSPEQAEGKPLDARTDLFSLGVVLYEMLCAQRPFRGETRISTIAAILRETPETPRRVRHEIPAELEQIVLRCLQKQPEARYGSAEELHTALERCRQTLSGRTGNIPWRRPTVIAAVLAVFLIAGALGVRWSIRAWRARWAERVAVPEISRLMSESHPLAAIRLLRQAEPYAASSPELIRLREQLVWSFVSRPNSISDSTGRRRSGRWTQSGMYAQAAASQWDPAASGIGSRQRWRPPAACWPAPKSQRPLESIGDSPTHDWNRAKCATWIKPQSDHRRLLPEP